MKKIVLVAVVLCTVILDSPSAIVGDKNRKICSTAWMVSRIEVEGYSYSDTAVASMYFQFYESGKCVIKIIEHKEPDKDNPGIAKSFNKGPVNIETTDWTFDETANIITINPSQPEHWAWNIKEISQNKIVFSSDIAINDMYTFQYTYTLVPLTNGNMK